MSWMPILGGGLESGARAALSGVDMDMVRLLLSGFSIELTFTVQPGVDYWSALLNLLSWLAAAEDCGPGARLSSSP